MRGAVIALISTVISSSVLILVILLLRKLFRGKVGNGFLYALWLLVAVRLILPAPEFFLEKVVRIEEPKISSSVSVMNLVEQLTAFSEEEVSEQRVMVPEKKEDIEKEDRSGQSNNWTEKQNDSVISKERAEKPENFENEKNVSTGMGGISDIQRRSEDEESSKKAEKLFVFDYSFFRQCIVYVWLFGCLLLLGGQVLFDKRFRKALAENREEATIHGQRVYKTRGIRTPLLFRSRGFTTDIYIPEQMMVEKRLLNHAILHEKMHQRHGDIWWGYLRNLLVAVYWFHPLVWVAAICSKRDCEYACDSSVMKQMNQEERISYGNSLLSLVQTDGKCYMFCTATEMRVGKSEMEERIKMVKRGIGKSIMATVLAVIVVFLVGVSAFTYAKEENSSRKQLKLQSMKQEREEKDASELTMEKLIDCYNKKAFSKWKAENVSKYNNLSKWGEDDLDDDAADVEPRAYAGGLSYQGVDYQVTIFFGKSDDGSELLDSVLLENKETEESRMIYSSDKSFMEYIVSPEEFLHHDKVLDERISYTLPENLLATKDSYSFRIAGRLFYEAAEAGQGIYGIMDTCLWSSAGGLMETNMVLYDQDEKTVKMSLADYRGNGRYAAGKDAVREFRGGKLQNISGCENITSIQGLTFTRDIVEETPIWFDKREAGKLTEKEMKKELFDRKLWIVSVMDEESRKKDNSVGFVFFFDAEKYTKNQMITLAKSIHLK